MSERKFYKSTITVQIISEKEPYVFSDFETLDYDISEGHFSGSASEVTSIEMNGSECAKALENQGSDPEFFRLSPEGEDLGEE